MKAICQVAIIVGAMFSPSFSKAGLPNQLNFSGGTYKTDGLYRGGSGDFFHVEYFPVGLTSLNSPVALDFLSQLYTEERLDQVVDLMLETLESWKPKGALTVIGKSENRIILKDVRFDGTISGSPSFILAVYELEGRTMLTSQLIFRPRKPYDSAKAFKEEFALREAEWLKELLKVAKHIHYSIKEEAEKPKK